jgi:hypothetical protein
MNRQPVPLPPARQPSLTTPRGHIKAVYLTREQLEQIIQNLRDGLSYQDACHAVGTSHLQFMRAVRRVPDLQEIVTEIKDERRRRKEAKDTDE